MEFVDIKPKQFPTNLLKKDWNQRVCAYYERRYKPFDEINEFEVRDDDVWLVTLPKSGTTWMQELLWLVINDFDFETAKNVDLEIRSPYLELEADLTCNKENVFESVNALKSPRLIKSHLPLPMLPPQLWTKKPKTVYVFRHPKDAWISFYHHFRLLGYNKEAALETFLDEFFKKRVPYEPPIDHASEFYALRNEPWIYYTSFERMKCNLREVIEDICRFLNKPITEEQMQKMLKHLSVDEMKRNPKTNHRYEFKRVCDRLNVPYVEPNFVREGKIGDHKNVLSPAMNARLDNYIQQECEQIGYGLNDLLLLR